MKLYEEMSAEEQESLLGGQPGGDQPGDRAQGGTAQGADPAELEQARKTASEAVAAAKTDAGAPFAPEVVAALLLLQKYDPASYQRGLADFKKAGCRMRDLEKILRESKPKGGTDKPGKVMLPVYTVQAGFVCSVKFSDDGQVEYTPLAAFDARITSEVVRDNGLECNTFYSISGTLPDGVKLPAVSVAAERFATMGWTASWGNRALVLPGQGTKDNLRAAIQLLSGDVPRQTVYAHTGWRKISGQWVYLHGGGAIGKDGITVDPEIDALKRYCLPEPGGDVAAAMRASLSLLDVASREVTLPLWAAVFRAPTACLLFPDLTLFLYGHTGAMKSTLAALFLSHWGAFSHSSLPESWLSTDNSIEKTASLCRDALLVIDDYAPETHPREAALLDKRINRFLRQVGNRDARSRLRSDLTSRPAYLPHCLPVSTGEQLPLGIQSVGARFLPFEVLRKEIDLANLTAAQAQTHLLPVAMRGYIEWLAPQMDELQKALPQRVKALRDAAQLNGHARLPEAVANLQLGAQLGLRFAVEIGAISQVEADKLLAETWEVLLKTAEKHARTLQQERPVLRFLKTLEAIFTQRAGHLVDRHTGMKPDNSEPWGWTGGEPGGKKLGWVDAQGIYLQPAAVWAAVNEYLRYGERIPVRERTLREMLPALPLTHNESAEKRLKTLDFTCFVTHV